MDKRRETRKKIEISKPQVGISFNPEARERAMVKIASKVKENKDTLHRAHQNNCKQRAIDTMTVFIFILIMFMISDQIPDEIVLNS